MLWLSDGGVAGHCAVPEILVCAAAREAASAIAKSSLTVFRF